MKKLFFFLVMMNLCFAGRYFIDENCAMQRLNDFECRLSTIRVRMNFGVTFEDFEEISHVQRMEQIKKFDELWLEFKKMKSYFNENLTTYQTKIKLVTFVIKLAADRIRYDTERINLASEFINHVRVTEG